MVRIRSLKLSSFMAWGISWSAISISAHKSAWLVKTRPGGTSTPLMQRGYVSARRDSRCSPSGGGVRNIFSSP